MDNGRTIRTGKLEIPLTSITRDPRGVEDMLAKVIPSEWGEVHLLNFDIRLYPFADAADLAEGDQELKLDKYPPLYTDPQSTCVDCNLGPCQLAKGKGRCGLEAESFDARLSLRTACKGCLGMMVDTRELVNYALKLFGRDKKAANLGARHGFDDGGQCIAMLTGLYVEKLGDIDQALSYAEAQVAKLLAASYSSTGSTQELEGMAFHAGSMLLLIMLAAEMTKINCFGLQCSSDQPLENLNNWPPPNIRGGLGGVEPGKPVIAFVGDNLLPAWRAVNYLKEKGLTEQIEICGLGPVGHDVVRFYDRGRVVGPMITAGKLIRTGFADVVVASPGSIPVDVRGEAKRVESKLIWTGHYGIGGLKDRTEDTIEEIVKDLIGGTQEVWIRDIEKAGEVAVRVAQVVKRKGDYLLSEKQIAAEAKRCREDCDLCFNACPNSLLLGRATRRVKKEGVAALVDAFREVEKGCIFCGKCDEVCPENIRLTDLIVATLSKRQAEDKFVMRSGRGSICVQERMAGVWGGAMGNSPGNAVIIGCGGARNQDDIGWIAHQLTDEGCYVMTAGCTAGEIGRHFEKEEQKFIYERFTSEFQPKNLINCGGCSAIALLNEGSGQRMARHVGTYANYLEAVMAAGGQPAIIWGVPCERMYAVIAGLARSGQLAIVGPASTGFDLKRYMLGNYHDRSKWYDYDAFSGKKWDVPGSGGHLIIPVETKEEAVAMAITALNRQFGSTGGASMPEAQRSKLDPYIRYYDQFFGELPDHWSRLLVSDAGLPVRYKVRLLKELRDKYGWEIDGLRLVKVKHPWEDELLTVIEYRNALGVGQTSEGKLRAFLRRYLARTTKRKLGLQVWQPELLKEEGKK